MEKWSETDNGKESEYNSSEWISEKEKSGTFLPSMRLHCVQFRTENVCTNNVFIVFSLSLLSFWTRSIISKMKMNIPFEIGIIFVQSHWTCTIASILNKCLSLHFVWVLRLVRWNRFLWLFNFNECICDFFLNSQTNIVKRNIYKNFTQKLKWVNIYFTFPIFHGLIYS